MAKTARAAIYEVVRTKVDGISQVMTHEDLDTLSTEDLEEIAYQFAVAAEYMSRLVVDRVN